MSAKPSSGEAMLAGLKPYPRMKDSGVEWLGEVPSHWGVRRLRNIANVRFSNVDKHSKEHEKAVRLCNYPDVYYNDRIHSDMDFMRATATDDKISRFELVVGDVLITKDSEAWDDIGVPALVESTAPGLVCGYHLALIRPKAAVACGNFLRAALSSPRVATQLHVCANGVTRFGLSQNAIRSTWLPAPPLSEQNSIARFLDHATSRIDRCIRAKEKLIALLEEQKQVIVHDAVTGRIDVRTGQPYPAYRPSGVEWLGDVPAHWDVRRLKTLSDMQSGDAITEMSIEVVGEYPVYGGNGLRGYSPRYTHDGAYALIGRQGALCGNVHLATGRFWASEHAVVAALHRDHVLEWFGALLQVMNLNQYSIAAAQPGLSVDRVLNLYAPVPSASEQAAIACLLEQRVSTLVGAIDRANREIELLREYRSRLITDVVTGKFDVREAAATLPEVEPYATGVASSREVDAGDAESLGEANAPLGFAG